MTTLFQYPPNAAFGRVLPKNKIYQHASPNSSVKELFVRQVEQITWQFKLAPETINIKGTKAVPEIQVFSIALKEGELKNDVLHCIDRAIPFPIFFELRFEERIKPVASYKRPNETDPTKWVLSEYFEGEWIPGSVSRVPLPVVRDLSLLYAELFSPLLPYPPRLQERLKDSVGRMECLRSKEKDLEKCETRLRKERQFNRRVAINAELRKLKKEFEDLLSSPPVED